MSTAILKPAAVPLAVSARTTAIATAGALLAFLPATVAAALADDRLLNGASLWLKPMHFELALAIQSITLALLIPLLSQPWQLSRTVRWTVTAASLASILELFYIVLQAARGRASHFNDATPLETALYAVMGIGSLAIVAGAAVVGYALWRSPSGAGTLHLRTGAVLGLIFGTAATLVLAGYMSSLHGHLVGGPQTDAFGLPFLGWATRGGDLRVPHFFATHAMQALPIAGLAADRLGLRVAWLMPVAAAVYFAGVLALFAQALVGLPLIPM